jgi:hypothetical protein
LLFYIALSLAFFGRAVDWSKYVLGPCADTLLFIWCLNWWPFALSHGLNPFITKFVWYPVGYNLTWATSLPFLALISWPVTVLGSPVLSYNILLLAAPALAAWTAFLLARELGCDWPAALIGGLLFGFSGPEVNQVAAEVNLDSVYFVPLAVLFCVRRVRGKMRRRSFCAALSLLLVAQLGTSTEVLASLCVFGALTWAIFLLLGPAGTRPGLGRLALDVAICVPIVAILAAPFLYYLILGLPDFPAKIHPIIFQENDLLQFVLPVIPLLSGPAVLHSVMREFTGFRLDAYAFAGIPLLVILALYFYGNFSKPAVRALLAAACVMGLLTLGPWLEFNGHMTAIPMPWALLAHIPLIRSIAPIRFLIYFSLGAALAAALFLTEANTLAQRLPRYALVALALLFLPPAKVAFTPQPWETQPIFQKQDALRWTSWPEHPFFTPEHVTKALGPMANVILLPDPVVGPGMAWQVTAGMRFTQAEGYIGYMLQRDQKWDISDVLTWNVQPDFGKLFTAFCAERRVDYVLIGPGTPPNLVSAIEALGWAHHMDTGIEIVKTPAGLF